jgi:hypothetical protein
MRGTNPDEARIGARPKVGTNNNKQQTTNTKQQTPNTKHQTPNTKHRTFLKKSDQIKALIDQNNHLLWYIPADKKQDISEQVLLETIFNYGDMHAVRQLLSILGVKYASELFFGLLQQSSRRKGNFHELTINFFTEFFNRHAS